MKYAHAFFQRSCDVSRHKPSGFTGGIYSLAGSLRNLLNSLGFFVHR